MTSIPVVPPIIRVTHSSVILSPGDIGVSVGQSRFTLVNNEETQEMQTFTSVEWSAVLSMSPTTAHSLYMQLSMALMKYREIFGPITEDKDFCARVTQAERSSLGDPELQ
jgi:hypothetical protein